jgi:hypothetical protein
MLCHIVSHPACSAFEYIGFIGIRLQVGCQKRWNTPVANAHIPYPCF